MKKLLLLVLAALLAPVTFGQVDVAHHRTLMLQGEVAGRGSEGISGLGYFWFNENNFPWTNTALRAIIGGIYNDAELSYFLPSNPNTAVGVGFSGWAYLGGLTPYFDGTKLGSLQFYGDGVTGRLFVNQTVPTGTQLPLNLRATYSITGNSFRNAADTRNFILPHTFAEHTFRVEARLGGIEPGLLAKRGFELYLAADTNYRNGFEAFGPTGALFPKHDNYQHILASASGRVPLGPALGTVRVASGFGWNTDELSAWRLGGNLLQMSAYTFTLHGYYTREILADDFVLANTIVSLPLYKPCNLAAHLYGDWATAKTLSPFTGATGNWHNYFGVGAGLSFRAPWDIDVLLGYGYGINAVRHVTHGGHEISLALEKKF